MIKQLIILVAILFITNLSFAQDVDEKKMNVVWQDVTLQEVIAFLEKETNHTFTYSSNSIPMTAEVSLSKKNATIWEILDQTFQYMPVSYELINKKIVLKYSSLNQTIRGSILDKDTQQPIIGATVIVVGSNPLKGNITDVNGNFRIENVSVGRMSLMINYLGYQDRMIPYVLLGSGKELVLNVDMVESVIKMQEIVVTATNIGSQPLNEMAMISGRSFTVEETKRFPISVGDPMRLASSFAGVMGTDDGSNEIVIRGNSPRGILWKMEGVEIPSPNHFSSEGAASGGISMFSTQVISRSDFYTGAFASEYGNALSGVFDINLRKGNNERPEHTIQAGFLGLDIASEGPLSKSSGSSYLFNYRYSTLAILDALGFEVSGEGEKNIFQDFSFKLNMPTEKMGTFSVFGMGGLSKYNQVFQNSFEDTEKYNMGVVGISNQYKLDKTAFITTTLSASGTKIVDDYVENYDQDAFFEFENITEFKKTYIRGSILLNKKFNAKHLIESGITISKLDYDFAESEFDELDTTPFRNFQRFNDKGVSGTQQGFVSWKFRAHKKLSLVGGLHYFRFNFNKETSLEPRASLKWQFQPNQSITLGAGLHSRIESLEYYLGNFINADGTTTDFNRDLGLTKARHFVIGYDRVLGSNLYFKMEAYYQSLYNTPVYVDPRLNWFSTINLNDGFTVEPLVNKGTGRNYGIEFTLDKKFSNDTYFLINASFFESKYTALDNIERNTKYNGNFSHHFLGGKEWKVGKNGKNNIFGISFKGSFSGNQRFEGIDLASSITNNAEIWDLNRIYTERLPDYFRIDLQFSFRKNKPRSTSEWRLDIQNVANRGNVLEQYYDNFAQQIIQEEQLGLIPVLSYRVEF